MHVTTIPKFITWSDKNLLKKYNLQFDLSDAAVTLKLGQSQLNFSDSEKLTGGYHHAKFEWSCLHLF